MSEILMMFKEGGAAMFAVLAFDVCAVIVVPLALILSIVARATGKIRTVSLVGGWIALVAALVPMCAGIGGYTLGMRKVDQAIEYVAPDQKERVREVGQAEAGQNLTFGFASGCCAIVPAVLALLLVPPKREAWQDL